MNEQDKRDARILANVRRIVKKSRMPNWVLAMETFGFGSTSANDMCKRLGLDPDSSETRLFTMLDHIEKPPARLKPRLMHCAADRDGECIHEKCPQIRDNEPTKSGRHCPLDVRDDD